MNSGSTLSAEDQKTAAIQRIAESAPFRRSTRIRELLFHIGECSLAGRKEDLSETRIAEQVFGRENYHSSEDNIVRVSARQLRSKLAEYYEAEGKQDDLILEIPKGGYRAVFRPRSHPGVLESVPAALGPVVISPETSRSPIVILAVACAILLAAVVFLWRQNATLRSLRSGSSVPTLFTPVARSGSQRTNIIVTDSALILWQSLIQRNIGLEDYAGASYFQSDEAANLRTLPGKFVQTIRSRQITSLADARTLAQIFQMQPPNLRGTYVHHARNIHVRDFDSDDNFVIIGSARSNPWAVLFEKNLKFTTSLVYGNSCFDNQHPMAGELPRYCPEDADHEQGRDYARVAVMRNGRHAGRVALIAGSLMESTEAAGDFFLNPDSTAQLQQLLQVNRLEDLPDYEVLLETRSVGGAGRSPRILLAHKIGYPR